MLYDSPLPDLRVFDSEVPLWVFGAFLGVNRRGAVSVCAFDVAFYGEFWGDKVAGWGGWLSIKSIESSR